MTNLLLADEINRTSSKTQSALLEVMEEGQVTVDGQTHALPKPFVVIATQNPVGSAGTQLLPQAQLDRFHDLRLQMGYPDFHSQVNILRDRQTENPHGAGPNGSFPGEAGYSWPCRRRSRADPCGGRHSGTCHTAWPRRPCQTTR